MKDCRNTDLLRPDDPPAMRAAIAWFVDQGFKIRRPAFPQLKFGPLNYYPATRTIQRDGAAKMELRGLIGLEMALCQVAGVATLDDVPRDPDLIDP